MFGKRVGLLTVQLVGILNLEWERRDASVVLLTRVQIQEKENMNVLGNVTFSLFRAVLATQSLNSIYKFLYF